MKSIYIHIPFCLKKCHYCDFYSVAGGDDLKDAYVDALVRHIEKRGIKSAETVFIGGGTPTLLTSRQLERLMKALCHLSPAEFTVEANPATVNAEKLGILKDGGVTRLSIGMQAAQDRLLKIIGRAHTNAEFLDTVCLAKRFGFDINADAMFSLPSQTEKEWEETLLQLVGLDIVHVSCYSLILSEDTPFGRALPYPLPSEESERRMQKMAVDILGDAGLSRYEISNYAKDGHRCIHNLLCWQGEEYAAFGAAACGYENGVRYTFLPDIRGYIENPVMKVVEELSTEDRISELCILSLRLKEGIDEAEFSRRFGIDIYERHREAVDRFVKMGLVVRENGHIRLTHTGFDLSNAVMEEFI